MTEADVVDSLRQKLGVMLQGRYVNGSLKPMRTTYLPMDRDPDDPDRFIVVLCGHYARPNGPRRAPTINRMCWSRCRVLHSGYRRFRLDAEGRKPLYPIDGKGRHQSAPELGYHREGRT